ncbi:MAG TPA: PDZ domain-containing protein, partial [Longimicrobiales bacterium]
MRKSFFATALIFAGLLGAAPAHAQQATKNVRSGYLGLRFEEVMERGDQTGDHVIVREVSRESPAEKAGVQSGDEIVRVNGLVPTNGKFSAMARTLVEGDTVRLRVKRAGKERDLTVIAAARPANYGFLTREIVIAPDSVRHLMLRFLDSARVHLDSLRLPSIRIMPGDSMIDLQIMPLHRMLRDSVWMRGDSTWLRFSQSDAAGRDGDHFERELGPGTVFRFAELGARSIGGAELTELDPAMHDYFKVDRGLLVLRVAPETPADRAGLEPGDVVVKAK